MEPKIEPWIEELARELQLRLIFGLRRNAVMEPDADDLKQRREIVRMIAQHAPSSPAAPQFEYDASLFSSKEDEIIWLRKQMVETISGLLDAKQAVANLTNGKAGDTVCEICALPNISWFVDSTLWDRVVPERAGVLCLRCFAERARNKGIMPTWELVDSEKCSPAAPTPPQLDQPRYGKKARNRAFRLWKLAETAQQAARRSYELACDSDGAEIRETLTKREMRRIPVQTCQQARKTSESSSRTDVGPEAETHSVGQTGSKCSTSSPCGEMVAKGVCNEVDYLHTKALAGLSCLNWRHTHNVCQNCGREEKI